MVKKKAGGPGGLASNFYLRLLFCAIDRHYDSSTSLKVDRMGYVSRLLTLAVLILSGTAQAESLPVPDRVVDCSATVAKPFPLLYAKFLHSDSVGTGTIFDRRQKLVALAASNDGSILAVGFRSEPRTSADRLWLVRIGPNGLIRERLANPPSPGRVLLQAFADGRYLLLLLTDAGPQTAEIGPDLDVHWRGLEIPADGQIDSVSTDAGGFTIAGRMHGLDDFEFRATFDRSSRPLALHRHSPWRPLEAEPMIRLRLSPKDRLTVRGTAAPDGRLPFAWIEFSRTGDRPWLRRFECRDCEFAGTRLSRDGFSTIAINQAAQGTGSSWDVLALDGAVDGELRPGIAVRLPPHAFGGAGPAVVPEIVASEWRSPGKRRLLVFRRLFVAGSGYFVAPQAFLVEPDANEVCRSIVDLSLPREAPDGERWVQFAPDGTVLVSGWGSPLTPSKGNRFVFIGRVTP